MFFITPPPPVPNPIWNSANIAFSNLATLTFDLWHWTPNSFMTLRLILPRKEPGPDFSFRFSKWRGPLKTFIFWMLGWFCMGTGATIANQSHTVLLKITDIFNFPYYLDRKLSLDVYGRLFPLIWKICTPLLHGVRIQSWALRKKGVPKQHP